jgi:UDP-N-acetylglucosamine 3-dehydrogenase
MRKVRLGVIGLGTFGRNHVAAYAEHPFAELIAVCDIKEELARETAERYNAKCYVDYREMLEDPTIQAVSVATPDFLHKEPLIACAEKGKHIL